MATTDEAGQDASGNRLPSGAGKSCAITLAACVLALTLAGDALALDSQDLASYRDWGLAVGTQSIGEFRRPGTSIYAEGTNLDGDQFGGINGNAFIWAASVQFRALNSRYALDPTSPNRRLLLGFSQELHQRYWVDSADGENGYVVAPGSTERYYDDNAHMTVALMEGFELTGDSRLLERAIATHEFVLEGEDSYQDGGIYFREGSLGNKNTISTLQEARGAAMIYQATGEQQYLDDAVRLLEWSNSHVQRSDKLYYQEYRDTNIGDIGNVPLTNGAGMGVLTNLELYDITGDAAYLAEAQRVGLAAARQFTNSSTGSVWGGAYWAFELVDAWVDLYQHSGSTRWLGYAADAVEFIKNDLEDNNGHYGRDWHTVNDDSWPELDDWLLIDQASVVRAYLSTGLAEAPAPDGDYNDDGVVDAADYTVWRASVGSPAGTLPNDADGGVIGSAQYQTWRANFGAVRFTLPDGPFAAGAVPSPGGLSLLCTLTLLAAHTRRRASVHSER
ncbi:Glycosyl hydrolase family 76 [Posidoniimonas polymericola]|uniref:Glycosyl hydrolase family 76 n=1 Tax=Posidoniimonas polymericola TaxID=2528002 RepID=A0A5C5ZHD2_9BACT|nr:glycoside hydrolase family 76 protein [Posidoniimonas polymericola]TWT85963.1 Glycosyl hydrolase family 76 [Posidoniimonas polymericola]